MSPMIDLGNGVFEAQDLSRAQLSKDLDNYRNEAKASGGRFLIYKKSGAERACVAIEALSDNKLPPAIFKGKQDQRAIRNLKDPTKATVEFSFETYGALLGKLGVTEDNIPNKHLTLLEEMAENDELDLSSLSEDGIKSKKRKRNS